LLPLLAAGQSTSGGARPSWTDGYFKELKNSYIEVVSAFGYDLQSARNKAAGEAIHRRSLATGAETSVTVTDNDVRVNSSHDVIVKARIIDEYILHSSSGYTVYLLVQTAKNPMLPYESVSISDEYAFSLRVFVPGMAQIHKGSTAKGIAFLASECLFIGGAVTGQLLASDNINKIASTHDASAKKAYTDNANAWSMVRNISIAGVAACYIWNVVDGTVAKGKKHVVTGRVELAMMPYSDFNSTGLNLALTF